MHRLPLLLLLLVLPSTLEADDVFLKNGRSFEDIEAEVVGDQVVVYLEFGKIGFSLDAVERIEESVSSQALYRQRRDELEEDPDATASQWLELGRWAASRGLGHGAREAGLAAARLDPTLSGLGSLLHDLDFVFDAELERWLPFEQKMQRDGFQKVDGQWLTAEQLEARARMTSEVARMREAEEERRLTRAMIALAAAQLAQEAQPQPAPQPVYAWPVSVYPNPFIWRHPTPHKLPPARHDPVAIPIERRQPGSLFPIQNRGGVSSPSTSPGVTRSMSGGSG